MAKEIIGEDLFSLVYVNTPLEACEQRDSKGLDKKATSISITNLTILQSELERPITVDIVLNSGQRLTS